MFKKILLATAVLLAQGAHASTITIQGSAPVVGNCIPFGCPGYYGTHQGFVYKNIPAFSMKAGDILAYDLGVANDYPLSFDVSLAATTTNGGTTASGPFVKIAGNSTAATPNGDNINYNYELAFVATSAFNFAGGGLMVDFVATGQSLSDNSFDQVLVGSYSTDPSNYFVSRYFYGDFAGDMHVSNGSNIGNFRIITGNSTVPEPSSLALAGLALAALAFARRRKA